jgi:hypothetical protein
MSLICPVCRASNDSPPTCRRCKADLTLCWTLASRREFHIASARAAMAKRDLDLAAHHLEQAEIIRAGNDLLRLRALLHLLRRDFDSALQSARLVRNLTTE